jgi:hypothetical protein
VALAVPDTSRHMTDRAARKRLARERLITVARLMDEAVHVPVLGTRVGLDALLGLVPVAGDLVSAAVGLFMVAQARELGASRWLQARMIGNLLADAAFGAVPIAGDLVDVYFKAHRRNLKLLQKALGEPYIAEAIDSLPVGGPAKRFKTAASAADRATGFDRARSPDQPRTRRADTAAITDGRRTRSKSPS